MGNNQCFKFVDLSITSAKLPFNAHLIWEHSTYGLILVDADDQTKLFISTDKADNWSEIDLSDNTNSFKIQSGWLDGNDLWLVMCDNDGIETEFEVCFVELDDSNDCNPVDVQATSAADAMLVYDIFKLGSDFYVYWNDDIGVGAKDWITEVTVSPFVAKDDLNTDGGRTTHVVVIGTKAYWWKSIAPFTSARTAVYDSTIPSITAPFNVILTHFVKTDTNFRGQSYDGSDILSCVLEATADNKNYLIEFSITGDSYTVGSEYNIILMLDRNNSATVPNEFEKAFDIARDANDLSRIWEIKARKGGLIQLQSIILAQNIIAITDNFLMFANGSMYEYTDILATNVIAEGKVNKGVFPILEKGNFNCHPDDSGLFYNDDSIKVYDESDVMVLFAKIENKSRDKDGIYVFGLDAYTNELWRSSYVKTHASTTTHEKQQDNIDNASSFCHRDSSIVATPTDYLYEQDRPPMSIFSLGRFMERQVGSASPNGLVRTEAYDGLTKAPQYYPGTYIGKDEVIGAEPSGWTINNGADCTTTIISELDGHKKVLQCSDNNAAGRCSMYKDSGAPTADSVWEFWVAKDSIAANTVGYIHIREGTTVLVHLIFTADDLSSWDGGAANSIKANFMVANTLNHIKVILNDAANTFDCYVNGILEGDDHDYDSNSTTGGDRIYIQTDNADTGYKFFIGAIGVPTFDVNYNVGENIVAWNVEVNGSVDLINISRDKPSYYVKKLGITRATCVGAVGISQTYADAALEDGKTVVPLKEYRDLRIEQNVEALQIATALFNVFSQETKFIGLKVVDQEYVQPGYTVNFSNAGDITIAEDDYLVLFYTYDWVSDVYDLMILTDNIVLLREFESYFDRSNLMTHQTSTAVRDNAHWTKEGGAFVKLTNETGVPSVKGSLVRADTVVDNAFILTAGDDDECLGVVYEDGIADGDECKIVFGGRVRVLLKDATASTAGNWVKTSDVAGRADATGATPAAAPTHFEEVGHCIETKGADTDVLAFSMLHFN